MTSRTQMPGDATARAAFVSLKLRLYGHAIQFGTYATTWPSTFFGQDGLMSS